MRHGGHAPSSNSLLEKMVKKSQNVLLYGKISSLAGVNI
jgi:hypothetical protein